MPPPTPECGPYELSEEGAWLAWLGPEPWTRSGGDEEGATRDPDYPDDFVARGKLGQPYVASGQYTLAAAADPALAMTLPGNTPRFAKPAGPRGGTQPIGTGVQFQGIVDAPDVDPAWYDTDDWTCCAGAQPGIARAVAVDDALDEPHNGYSQLQVQVYAGDATGVGAPGCSDYVADFVTVEIVGNQNFAYTVEDITYIPWRDCPGTYLPDTDGGTADCVVTSQCPDDVDAGTTQSCTPIYQRYGDPSGWTAQAADYSDLAPQAWPWTWDTQVSVDDAVQTPPPQRQWNPTQTPYTSAPQYTVGWNAVEKGNSSPDFPPYWTSVLVDQDAWSNVYVSQASDIASGGSCSYPLGVPQTGNQCDTDTDYAAGVPPALESLDGPNEGSVPDTIDGVVDPDDCDSSAPGCWTLAEATSDSTGDTWNDSYGFLVETFVLPPSQDGLADSVGCDAGTSGQVPADKLPTALQTQARSCVATGDENPFASDWAYCVWTYADAGAKPSYCYPTVLGP